MTTARSFIAASAVSHSSAWLPSIMTMRSPGRTPWADSQLAAWSERRRSSSKLSRVPVPSSSTMCSAVRSLSRAMASNQSSAQLKWVGRGQRNSARAAS